MFERRDFHSMMPHTVQIAPYTGRDRYGQPQYGSSRTYTCRIVGKGIALRRTDTEDDTIIYDVYLDAQETTFTVHDRVTLPSNVGLDNMGANPVIFSIGRFADSDGEHHVKVQCGWMYHRQGQ